MDEDSGDDHRGDRDPAHRARPAPSAERLISWGSTPAGAPEDAEEPDDEPTERVVVIHDAPDAPPHPLAPVVTAVPTLPPTIPRQQTDSAPPPPSSRAPGTFESLAPPVVHEAAPPEPAAPRRWASPSISAPTADDRPAPRPPARPEPRVQPAASTDPAPPVTPPTRPVSITELSHQLTTIEAQLSGLAERGISTVEADTTEERPTTRTEAGLRHLSKQLASVQGQLAGLAEHVTSGAVGAGEKRSGDRTSAAITELSQQLAATQAQVTSLSAQLTTLAHRVTYDLERGAQTTTERLVRDLPTAISAVLAAELGPAIDDLTDQVEADREALNATLEAVRAQVVGVGESIEGLPLSNVEVLTSLKAIEHDLEDRLARLTNRMTDQVATLERSNAAELVRVRDHVADLHDLVGSPSVDAETLDRMAGQVERLSQRMGGGGEVVDALELLIAEHLEVLRDEIETRVGALAPMLQEELEAVRSDAVAGVGATEDALAERLEALETALLERLDAAMAEQLAGLDALLQERQPAAADDGHGDDGAEVAEALAGINEELAALRRRISLRAGGGEGGGGLSDEQLEELAERVAGKLRQGEADDAPDPTMPVPRHAASRGTPRRTPRATKRS